MVQKKQSTSKILRDPRPYTVTLVKESQEELMRGEKLKRRSLNLVKKILKKQISAFRRSEGR